MFVKRKTAFWCGLSLCLIVLCQWLGSQSSFADNQVEPEDKLVRIPLVGNTVKDNHPYVLATIDGSEPLPFMLDTGNDSPILIEGWAVKKLRLKQTGITLLVKHSPHPFPSVEVHTVTLPGTIAGQDADIDFHLPKGGAAYAMHDINLDVPPYGRCAGAIGMNFFQDHALTLDLPHHLLTLHLEPLTPAREGKALVLPLQRPNPDPHYPDYFASLNFGKHSYSFRVDTGADTTSFPNAQFAQLPQDYPPQAILARLSMGVFGMAIVTQYLFHNFRVGPYSVPWIYVNNDPVNDTPLLGMDVLSQFIMTLDAPHKTLILVPQPSSALVSSLPGEVGFWLSQSNGRYFVNLLVPGCPAAQAGLREGDEILGIDSNLLAALRGTPSVQLVAPSQPLVAPLHGSLIVTLEPNPQITLRSADSTDLAWYYRSFLDGTSGTAAEIVIARNGKTQTLRFQRSDDTDRALYLPVGCRFSLMTATSPTTKAGVGEFWKSYALFLSALLPDSPLFQQGLKPGDFVLSINDVPVSNQNWAQVQTLLMPKPGRTLRFHILRLSSPVLRNGKGALHNEQITIVIPRKSRN